VSGDFGGDLDGDIAAFELPATVCCVCLWQSEDEAESSKARSGVFEVDDKDDDDVVT